MDKKEYLPIITKQKILDKHILHLKKGHHLRILGKNNQRLAFPYDYATYCKQQ